MKLHFCYRRWDLCSVLSGVNISVGEHAARKKSGYEGFRNIYGRRCRIMQRAAARCQWEAAMNDEIEMTDEGIKRLEELGDETWLGRMRKRLGKNIPSWNHYSLACQAAAKYGLDEALVCALCEVESSWMPWAVRHEAGYKWLIDFHRMTLKEAYSDVSLIDADQNWWVFEVDVIHPPGDAHTELLFQQTSWGLLQIMGAVARERGFRGWLTELCDPQVNLEWGCKHLRWMIDHNNAYGLPDYRIKPEDLAAAWNGGKARIVNCPECGGVGIKTVTYEGPWNCLYCHGTGKAYANEDYVKRVVRAMEHYK